MIDALIDGLTFEIGWDGWDAGPDARVVQTSDAPLAIVRPSPHIIAGARTLPVLRGWFELALELGRHHAGLTAYGWPPAGHAMPAPIFADEIGRWLGGGAFPVASTIAFVPSGAGALRTRGLGFFTGQEIELDGTNIPDPDAGKRLALRIANQLVLHGRLVRTEEVGGPDGSVLRLEPSRDGKTVMVYSR